MIQGLKPYIEMKDSGIEWLGRVPAHWDSERAKWLFQRMERPVREEDEVVTCFRDGVVTLRKNRRELGFTESLKEIGYQGIRVGDLVIHSMDAFAGAIGIADSNGKGTPVYSVCKPGSQVNVYFYAYILREMARRRWIQALAKGIRERSSDFKYTDFVCQLVPRPSLSEQAAIVRFLHHADWRIRRSIRAKQKLLSLLEEQKQAIIQKAVTGKIDVRTAEPYPAYKPSELEWLEVIPEHWTIRPLKRVVRKRVGAIKAGPFGSDLKAIEMMGTEYKVYTQKNVIEQDLSSGRNYISFSKFEELRAFEVFPGDVLVTSRGTIGRTVLVANDCEPGILHPCLLRIQPDPEYIKAEYLMLLIQYSQFLSRQLKVQSNATTIEVIYTSTLANLTIPLPPIDEQIVILDAVKESMLKLETAVSKASKLQLLLTEYRTRLISDVVTGKLDVRKVATELPDEADALEPSNIVGESHRGDHI